MPASLLEKPVPKFPGFWKALGPGVVWLALAQGSGELIWWPYLVAKYGLGFLCLLIPACLIQFPLNYQIGCYTVLTGESIFQGFLRLNRAFALCLWILMTISFFWFGAFASAGGTALAALTDFPHGWSERGQTLFWAYASMAVFFSGILFSKVIYQTIEKVMWAVSMTTMMGLVVSCLHPDVRTVIPDFLNGLTMPEWPAGRTWDPEDATKLLTAVTFAGLGGFWTLFYSYWLREKGSGMAAYAGHVTGSLLGERERIAESGFSFEGSEAELREIKKWKRYLKVDSAVGILGNLATTLMTCLLAYALLFPQGILPEKYEIAVVQARFFEVSWGLVGKVIFLLVAACFLSDTWLATLDAVSRIHTDFLRQFFPSLKKWNYKTTYTFFVCLLTAVTAVTILFQEPGPLILLSAVIGFIGTVSFSFAILTLNHRLLPTLVPAKATPGKLAFGALFVVSLIYLILALLYFAYSYVQI